MWDGWNLGFLVLEIYSYQNGLVVLILILNFKIIFLILVIGVYSYI